MPNLLKSFKYSELGSEEKTKGFEIILDDNNDYILQVKGDKKDYKINSKDVEEIFNKYAFKNLTIDVVYPFPIKEQIDYRIEGVFFNSSENFDLNGYSHFPVFFNEFITNLSRVSGAKSLFKCKVKEEMLDKDKKYHTNYIEKLTVNTSIGKIIVSVDKVVTTNYEVDVSVEALDNYFKFSDLSFILPVNVSFFTYSFNKTFKFSRLGKNRNYGLKNYIDVRLKNKKHRYFDLDEEITKESFTQLINFLNMFIKIPILNAFVDNTFINRYIEEHKKPKSKAEVTKDYFDLIKRENYTILDALKKIARDNQNLDMNQLVSIAYKLQDTYYVYQIDEKGIKEHKITDTTKTTSKKLLSHFKNDKQADMGFIDISKDYDAHYNKEGNIIYLKIVATRYPELDYLKMDYKTKELISKYFENNK